MFKKYWKLILLGAIAMLFLTICNGVCAVVVVDRSADSISNEAQEVIGQAQIAVQELANTPLDACVYNEETDMTLLVSGTLVAAETAFLNGNQCKDFY